MPILTPDEIKKIEIYKPISQRVNFKADWLFGEVEVKNNELIITQLDEVFVIPIKTKFNYVKQSYYDFISLDLLPFEAKMMINRAGGKTGKKNYITYLNRALIILCKDLKNITGLHVHHIDGNSLNNTPSNLIALKPDEHRKIHANQILISDISLTLPDKRKNKHKKAHISQNKAFAVKKMLIESRSANFIKQNLKVDKSTIKKIDHYITSPKLIKKLCTLKAKLLKTLKGFFSSKANKPKTDLKHYKHCISNSITYPNYTFNNDSS